MLRDLTVSSKLRARSRDHLLKIQGMFTTKVNEPLKTQDTISPLP